jgi:hypothetical protein
MVPVPQTMPPPSGRRQGVRRGGFAGSRGASRSELDGPGSPASAQWAFSSDPTSPTPRHGGEHPGPRQGRVCVGFPPRASEPLAPALRRETTMSRGYGTAVTRYRQGTTTSPSARFACTSLMSAILPGPWWADDAVSNRVQGRRSGPGRLDPRRFRSKVRDSAVRRCHWQAKATPLAHTAESASSHKVLLIARDSAPSPSVEHSRRRWRTAWPLRRAFRSTRLPRH